MQPRAEIIVRPTDGEISVWSVWEGVDRPRTHGIACSNMNQAKRLARAIEAGVVYENPKVRKDIEGETYVDARCTLYTRHLNKELTRVGF